jgi:hypothetical protein
MSRDISKLSPAMQAKWLLFKKQCDAENLGVFIVCTDRNEAEQNACLAANPPSTKAAWGQSAHNALLQNGKPASEAWDIGVIFNGRYIGDSAHPSYQRAGVIGMALGLKWYGELNANGKPKYFYEAAHFQNMLWSKPK